MSDLKSKALLQSIAHDLRSPLSRACLYLEAAKKSLAGDAEAYSAIDGSVSELDSISHIIHVSLSMERIRSMDARQVVEHIRIDLLVSEIAELFEPLIHVNNQHLVIDAADHVQITGIEQQLRQALFNLVENAVQHCPINGVISIRVGIDNVGAPVVGVSDTGPGIPVEAYDAVVLPFFRLDGSRTCQGFGLGLAYVNAVVNRHSATLSFMDGQPGLQVVITFPAS